LFPLVTGLNHPLFDQLNPFKWHFVQTNPIGLLNISTTYHPQTDGQSEKTNQHVETALRIFCNYQQSNWADFIPMVQYMLNARPSETTKKAPFELWMGYIPCAHQPELSPPLGDQTRSSLYRRVNR